MISTGDMQWTALERQIVKILLDFGFTFFYPTDTAIVGTNQIFFLSYVCISGTFQQSHIFLLQRLAEGEQIH